MNNIVLDNLLSKYGLINDEKEGFLSMIINIYSYDEFQRRMTDEFFYHDKITLGSHILEDAIVTYLLSKNIKGSRILKEKLLLR